MVFVAGAVPGDRVRAEVGKAKKAYAEARAIEIVEPSPDRVPEFADHPGAPWQVLPYERQLAVKAEQVEDALRRIGKLDGFELEPIVPAVQQWRYRNKLEYSFGTGDDGELVCGFHAPGRWNDILPMTDCKLAQRALERAARAGPRLLPRAGAAGLGPQDPPRLPAQPRRPRGPPHRPDPGAADHLARQARRRRLRRRRRRRRRVVDADRRPRREHLRRRVLAALRRPAADRAPERPRLPDLARGLLPDQHRDGREALRRRARVRRAARRRAGLRPLQRHRHDRALARHPRAPRDRAGDRRVRRRRRDRERPHQRDGQRLLLRRRRPARAARAGRARGPARPRDHRPAARGPLAEGRAPDRRRRAVADRLRLLQPDDAGARTRPSSSRRATSSRRSARSTCSRRPRTSSAWRCWRPARTGSATPTATRRRRRRAGCCGRPRGADRPASAGARRPRSSR